MSEKKSKDDSLLIRHRQLMKEYLKQKQEKPKPYIPPVYRTEKDIIEENHKFIRSELDDQGNLTWEQRVAKKYYDALFKEYAICELKYYKEGRIALRWRTEKEVVVGKGQFICASTRCDQTQSLKSWEVNFGYIEEGEKKNELVKVRLCPECSDKLNYKTKRRLAKRRKEKEHVEQEKKKRRKTHAKSENINESDQEKDDAEVHKGLRLQSESSIWSKPVENKQEKSREQEFEDYFADLLQ
ncbi:folate-sensitive fragile site protein Fra10Ac1-domain-containing protein [Cokeromyces recurvatus]|uniref:folate-sensitive fragile site protein Fra10Ac1-domain-containing protein n=1 Tax=Cokeromyces recurvatus TaxID=90255 RepID=UPI002220CA00|nr:folate-sensitive fragile site protein Fra10Ac1-domain-containing protein [Cokeromyces recurvatus]KAI7904954.1 folate-sensitive fragile site protein Fra10Ac1-domain-containing protein [Cokeromyces recurvatus]